MTRGAWRAAQIAALCPALAVLFATLVMCLGFATHAGSDGHAAAMTSLSARAAVAAGTPAEHRSVPTAHPGGCPAGDVCCAPAAHGVGGVPAAPVQPLPAILPRMPHLPMRQDGPAFLAQAPPTGGAPDLHVLQVQRT
ncbi:hypothetical protein [Streptomyces pseudovenezuelae]|uniref:hypothetical protein n=1 Tax=Streptomyces pseudovenezuelae TaxID=67350 RepID=UPI002E807434|nr:hypothetical protein [Streptomyces pseudovenezuelae]WUA87484.1 hypothetical protein OHO81_09365 [Streptomyces pseudovenezuelae]